jgi:hypothetical protein
MIENDILRKLLGQSRGEYAKYLADGETDFLAEAGELLWQCLKADITQSNFMEKDNLTALKAAAAQMGETYNQLFYQCYHFHSWYTGGVPNDFVLEKKLYLKTAKSVETLIKNRENNRINKRETEFLAKPL